MKHLKTQMTTSKNKLLILAAVAIVAIGAGFWYYAATSQPNTATPSQVTDTTPSQSDENKEGTSEDTTFPVPGDTPDGAIKDYKLIEENEQFKIRQIEGTNRYTITLYAIINNPSQYDYYREQLKQYKQQALDYLKGKGLDPAKLDITYEPAEAKDL